MTTTSLPPLVQDIYAASPDQRVRSSELLGALLEGGSWSGPWATGDAGTSGGPFQIHWTVHPDVVAAAQARGMTPEQLVNDPAYAVQYMTPEYTSAVGRVPASLWSTNPERAAEQAAYYAERPAQDYFTARGGGAVDAEYAKVQAFVASGQLPAGTSGSGGTAATDVSYKVCVPGTSLCYDTHIPTPGDIWHDAGSILKVMERVALGILGGLIIALGLYVTVRGPGGVVNVLGGGGSKAGAAGDAAEVAAV